MAMWSSSSKGMESNKLKNYFIIYSKTIYNNIIYRYKIYKWLKLKMQY